MNGDVVAVNPSNSPVVSERGGSGERRVCMHLSDVVCSSWGSPTSGKKFRPGGRTSGGPERPSWDQSERHMRVVRNILA